MEPLKSMSKSVSGGHLCIAISESNTSASLLQPLVVLMREQDM